MGSSTVNKLAIGPFKDMSGYATLARAYILSVLSVGNLDEWACAATKYDSGSRSALPETLKQCLKRQISNEIKTTVQVITPNEMAPHPNTRNIGICCWETDRIPKHWAESLNRFDIIVVPCSENKLAFEKSGVTTPIVVIGMPIVSDYSLENVKKYDIPMTDENTTVYYNISQWSHKKGIDALIRSYFLAFQNKENVLLVLKGYVGMLEQRGDGHKLIGAINEIKTSMRLAQYPSIFISDETTSDEGVKRYHATGDCYVNFTRGEGWCIPAFDAAMYGKELITVNHTAMLDWVNPKYVWSVASELDSVHNMPHPDPNLYTANECWYEPNIVSGAKALKEHFEGMKRNSSEFRKELLEKFNITKVGSQLLKVIENE
jgi:glycosyltransferase involved in cell wall biosynthesis